MAYINGNKPIVTDGLIYALDFGNSRCYTSGSTQATSLAYDRATTSILGSPTFNNDLLDFTSTKFIKRDGSLPALDPNGTFTVMFVGNAKAAGTFLRQDTLNSTINPTSSLFGFGLDSGDFSRSYPGFTSSSLQHVTYRYSEGTIDTFINGIPVTASVANASLTNTAVSNALFIGSGSAGFSGSLAQFYVYNRALSADEIYTTYLVSAERNGLPTVPKPYTQDENVYKYVQTTGITDLDTISAIDTFVSSLKSNGLWNKMTAIYPFLTTSTGSQAVNLKDPGVLGLGLTGLFTGSNVGLTPASSTAYVDTLPSNIPYPSIDSASAHLSLLSYDVPQGNGFLAGNSLPAIGGDLIVQSGSKWYHIYTNVGTSSFTMALPTVSNVEVLVIAGGGGGGSWDAGGGGAGGLIYSASFNITPGTNLPVIVGNGGLAALRANGTNGQNSVFSTLQAIGGGGGSKNTGLNGGSGGGGGNNAFGGLGVLGQGNNGGKADGQFGGAGGGSGTSGSNAIAPIGGTGGSGSYFLQYANINLGFPSGWFAGGGAGGYGVGGIGGGGGVGQPGVTNTGGGGGGHGNYSNVGGNGGSGIVIVSYDFLSTSTALTGSGTGFYLTDSALTASVNSQFTSGITGSGNIGFLTVSRTGSNSFSIRKNNSTVTINSASLGALSTDIFFNTANLAGSGSLPQPTSISYASIGAGLTDSEVSTYYNLVSQFQTNLKRQNTLLDNYSGAAAAYSLRRIGPSGYFGPAIRVRRDSDNALRDIGFTSDGQLDTVGLLDFVGVTGSGFVQTWYDQSGNNNNAIQATAGNQPLVITSGSTIIINQKPAIRAVSAGSTSFVALQAALSYIGSTLATYTVFDTLGSNPNMWVIKLDNNFSSTTDGIVSYKQDSPLGFGSYRGTSSTLLSQNQRVNLGINIWDGTGLITTLNTLSTSKQTTTQGTNPFNFNTIQIGQSQGGTGTYNFNEILIYTNTLPTDTSSIQSNINNNYKIYGDATASFDPDYQAFITATGITQPTQSAALETLVSDLKSYGLWNKMKAIYPMVTDRNNRFAQSENFDLTWNAVSASVSPNQTTAPNGTTTADLILDIPSVTNEHYIYQTIDGATGIVSGSEYVISAYAKFYNTPYIAFKTNVGAQAWFDVQTGVTGSYTGSNATITNVGNGWYRCALYFTSSGVTGPYNQHIHLARTDNDLTFTGTGTSGSYLWGAQFENGNLLGPYRKTEGSGFAVSGSNSMLDQMKYNLKDTGSFSGSYFGGWNPGYSGNKPNGVNGYMDTNFNPSTQLSSTNASMGAYVRSLATVSTDCGIGGIDGGASLFRLHYAFGAWYISVINQITIGPAQVGWVLATRTNSTLKGFKNRSTPVSTTSTTAATFQNKTIPIGKTTDQDYSNFETTFFHVGEGLTDYEAKALYWIVQKYQTTLGRQVY